MRSYSALYRFGRLSRIGTVRYNWPMSAHASQAFSMNFLNSANALKIVWFVQQLTYM